jgi:hypothetical protein
MPSIALLLFVAAISDPKLVSVAEKSGFVRTGRYDDAIALCDAFARAFPQKARCERFATTPEGRPMLALILADDVATAKARPVILAQGGIHAGEIDGKDAGFQLARELLEEKGGATLKAVTFVLVPVFNVDGHERFGKFNRPNQRGPEEMGWRTTGQNLNLNRDYMKADAPEMRAMLSLLNNWDPIVYLDLHVTDGAKFRHDVAVLVEPTNVGAPAMKKLATQLRDNVIARITKQGHLPVGEFYPSFEKEDDPTSGFAVGVAPPRFSTPYWMWRNRIGILVETHSWKDYKTRVKATHDILAAVLAEAVPNAKAWLETARALDAEKIDVVDLAFDNTDEKKTIDFLGYKYRRELSPVSGQLRIIYDEKSPDTWRVPLVTGVKAALSAKAPKAYVVPAAYASLIGERLSAHGIKLTTLDAPKNVNAKIFRATKTTFGTKPYEGRMTLKVEGAWSDDKRVVEKGALLVPVAQPLGKLVVHLFEPQAPDSFLSWGFFNASFEQKEYMEAYVAEDVAEQMLRDPKIAAEFHAALADPEFAKDANRRLDWFYKRHPSFDARYNVYPVIRLEEMP